MTPLELFNRWYVQPIAKLKELPNGDGGFAALMIALPLYERFIIGKLKLEGRATGEADVKAEMARDLGISEVQQAKFWAILRVGFMHQAMGQGGRTQWLVSHKFSERPVFREVQDVSTVCLDPWKFADRVLREFLDRPDLITASESFPLASIYPMRADELDGPVQN